MRFILLTTRVVLLYVLTLILTPANCIALESTIIPPDSDPAPEVLVQVTHLTYSTEHKKGVCFSSGYLDLLARETDIQIDRTPIEIKLESNNIYDYPFAVMTGEGDFILTDSEVIQLRSYLSKGGFLLASSGCSNAAWDTAFRREFKRVMETETLEELPLSHEIFHTVFQITRFQTKEPGSSVKLFGLEIDGRLVMIYSPEGLNDTGNAGGGCCCCGGNEIRNAKYINANVLAYALYR